MYQQNKIIKNNEIQILLFVIGDQTDICKIILAKGDLQVDSK